MKVISFQDMLKEYEISTLDSADNNEREKMLLNYKYSIIVEGGFMEYDNLEKWMKANFNNVSCEWLFYGKIGYDYGFKEYFFESEEQAFKVTMAVPNIYTCYPKASDPQRMSRSNGYDDEVLYDPEDKNAILVDILI